jgi:hypothetical protein
VPEARHLAFGIPTVCRKASAAVRTPSREKEAKVYWVGSKPIYFSGHIKEERRKQRRF